MTTDNEESVISPIQSMTEESRATTPALSEAGSSMSHGNVTGDSFFNFMTRLVKSYMEEEEVRARHQATLLELRENAMKERTNVRE